MFSQLLSKQSMQAKGSPPHSLAKEMMEGMSTPVAVMRASSFHFEFDQGMVRRVHIFRFTGFTQIKIITDTALEANSCNGRHLTSIASDSVVDNRSINWLTVFE
jgi:hypothetical protein